MLAAYNYLGQSTAVQIQYPLVNVMLDLWGGTSGVYNGFDRFGRIIDQRWINYIGGTVDIDRYKYGYDRNSNRTWKENTVSKSLGTPVYLDEFYTYDNLNRLTVMQRGQLTGSPPTGISGTPGKEQDWTLDKTGNWSNFTTKSAGTTDLNQTRTSNTVNELTGFTTSTGTSCATPAYDAAGNTITMPQPNNLGSSYTATYDAWNRMVSISDSSNTVAQYQYDGRGRRAVKLTYTGGTLSETRHFYWSNSWRGLEERTGMSTSADRQYMWGIRYFDELICRDAFSTKLYALQDAHFNLTAITDTSGAVQERYMYTPYGMRSIHDASWTSRTSSSYSWDVAHQGLFHDSETGLIYNRARYLHPLMGRYVQREPIAYVDGANLYQYVRTSPTCYADPNGLDPMFTPEDAQEWVQNYWDMVNAGEPLIANLILRSYWEWLRDTGMWTGSGSPGVPPPPGLKEPFWTDPPAGQPAAVPEGGCLSGAAGVAAAAASAAIITYLMYKNLKVRYENQAAEGDFALDQANQKSRSEYWHRYMRGWGRDFLNNHGIHSTPGCDSTKFSACEREFLQTLGNVATMIAIGGRTSNEANTAMIALIAKESHYIFENLSDCVKDACPCSCK